MVTHIEAIGVIVGVKNGPPGMWRSLADPGPVKPISGLITSPLALALGTCAYLALVVTCHRLRRQRVGSGAAGAVALVALSCLGLLTLTELAVRSAGLGLFLWAALVAAWYFVLRVVVARRAHETPTGAAEVVGLARWRKKRNRRGLP